MDWEVLHRLEGLQVAAVRTAGAGQLLGTGSELAEDDGRAVHVHSRLDRQVLQRAVLRSVHLEPSSALRERRDLQLAGAAVAALQVGTLRVRYWLRRADMH